MKARLEQIRDRINALSLRERVLVFLAVAAVVAFLWNALFMEPLATRQETAQEQVSNLRDRVANANDSIRQVIAARKEDPDAERRRRLAELEEELSQLDERLGAMTGDLVEPVRMAHVLEQILERQAGLQLISLKALAPRPLLEDEELENLGNIYRHGVRLELEGSYTHVLRYLRALEELDSDLYWGRLDINMERYPRNRIVLVVHTLSMREGWIGV